MRIRFILGVLIALGLLVLVIILIVKAVSGPTKQSVPEPLVDYANTGTSMQLLIDGPVEADQTHRAVQITIGQDTSEIDVLQGYQGNVIARKDYANNSNAYAVFLRTIDLLGYTKGNPNGSTDYRGFCPFGDRYVFGITSASGQTIQNFWSTSCGGVGTFQGNVLDIISLFQNQIPDYGTITNGVNI